MNKALFEVGEVVMIESQELGSVGKATVLESRWKSIGWVGPERKEETNYWSYKTTIPAARSNEEPGYWHESALRKLPPPADCSFDQLIKNLNTPVTEECTG